MAAKTPLRATARDHLSRALHNIAWEKLQARHHAKMDILAREALENVYGPTCISSFEAAPKGWLGTTTRINISSSDYYWLTLDFGTPLPVPHEVFYGKLEVTDEALRQRCEAAAQAYREDLAALNVMEDEARRQLRQIRSLERLQEEWPEAYSLLRPEDKGSPNLPAQALSDLRAKFAAIDSEAA